jgi:cellulose biosynthesis protein BcsQ
MEDNLLIPTKPEFKLHNSDPLWNHILDLHNRRMEDHQIAYNLNMRVEDVKDILEYIKKNKYASK